MRDLTRPEPAGDNDDAPCAFAVTLHFPAGHTDVIAHVSVDHLRGYVRALRNHDLITQAEFERLCNDLARQWAVALLRLGLAGTPDRPTPSA